VKKLSAFILTAVIILSLSAAAVTSALDFEYDVHQWGSGIVIITKYTGNENVVNIPDTIEGVRVFGLVGSAFNDRTDIEVINIPETMVMIEPQVFFGCTAQINIFICADSNEKEAVLHNISQVIRFHYSDIKFNAIFRGKTYDVTDEEEMEQLRVDVLGIEITSTEFSTADATTILRYAAGLVTLSEADLTRFDLNGDGVVNSADALLVLRNVARLGASPAGM
jgi:hypothetical protein